MSREVCGICWCPYDEDTGACACEPEPKKQHMTDLRTAAQQALRELDKLKERGVWGDFDGVTDALKAALVEDAMQKFTDVNQELMAALAGPVQEPVAWLVTDCIGERYLCFSPPLDSDQVLPLYAAPPQRKPLPEEEIREMFFAELRALPSYSSAIEELPERFARAIERAHGITE